MKVSAEEIFSELSQKMVINGITFTVYKRTESTFMISPETKEKIEFLENISNSRKSVSINFIGNKSTNILRFRSIHMMDRVFEIDLFND